MLQVMTGGIRNLIRVYFVRNSIDYLNFTGLQSSAGGPGHGTPGPTNTLGGPFSLYNPGERERLER